MAVTRIVTLRAAAVVVDQRPRCWRCERVLIESAARPWHAVCGRCNAQNHSEPVGVVDEGGAAV